MNRPIKFRIYDEGIEKAIVIQWDIQGNLVVPKDMPLMQFTGLSDLNGLEIYEGDIVQKYAQGGYGDGRSPLHKPFVIEWIDTPYDLGWNIHRTKSRGYRVIGNIYQDSHLLTDYEPPTGGEE